MIGVGEQPRFVRDNRKRKEKMTEGKKFLRRKELSAITGLSVAYFKRAAVVGGGPPYSKIGKAVIYSTVDVENWLESRKMGAQKEQVQR